MPKNGNWQRLTSNLDLTCAQVKPQLERLLRFAHAAKSGITQRQLNKQTRIDGKVSCDLDE
jgi:hypothetical protein